MGSEKRPELEQEATKTREVGSIMRDLNIELIMKLSLQVLIEMIPLSEIHVNEAYEGKA